MRAHARLAATLLALRVATLPVAAHETGHETGHTPWQEWLALAALVVGLGVLTAGLYVDHVRDERTAYADAFVVVGLLLALGSMAVFWL